MTGMIVVEFYSGHEPLTFSQENSCLADSIIVQCCKYLKISPIARTLFGLWNAPKSLWFPCSKNFDISNGKTWNLYLKIRYKTPSIKQLTARTDPQTLNYYFHQVHYDFLNGKIPDLFTQQMRDDALGLVATDIVRVMLETNMTPDSMKYNSRNFIPRMLKKNPVLDYFLQGPMQNAVTTAWINSKQNLELVKRSYLHQLLTLVPDYGSENYSVLIDENGKVYQVDLVVNPCHSTCPGIRMKIHKSKDPWTHICTIEDLCYISMRTDETVEISRKNGVPQYIQFLDKDRMCSFVSLLDGYYRLTEKWTFNLCKDMATPSLINLKSMKCHGPVGNEFAFQKLEDKANNEEGCYIIRESEAEFDEFFVDVWTNSKTDETENIIVRNIKKDADDFYQMIGWNDSFPSMMELLSYHTKNNNLKLSRCIPPSEYDVSNLLLCRKENQDKQSLITRGDCSCAAQCIPHDAISFLNASPKLNGKFTLVSLGHLRRSCIDTKAVAVKALRKETKLTHLQEFLSQCDKVLYWQHDNIVSTIGMILTHPTALVMEWLPNGTLDSYLRGNKDSLQEVDLIEAAFYLARALWYLEEQRSCHGNIRCHNVLVAAHTDSSFVVKLADPGVIAYSDLDLHWIPPECYHNYSLASRSILADVYAYGTTLWQMFSYGVKPMAELTAKQVKEWYQRGNTLKLSSEWRSEIHKIISECWMVDQDNRKRPQAIVRDVNHNLYEVYNSRRGHSYARIDPTAIPVVDTSPAKPPLPVSRPPVKEPPLNAIRNFFKWSTSKGISYDALSQSKSTTSTMNSGSTNSTTTLLHDRSNSSVTLVKSDSPSSISEPEPILNNYSGDLSWVIEKEQIILKGKIGEGFYGEVSKATLNYGDGSEKIVAVKRIKTNSQSPICVNELKREMEIMKKLCHKNIVRIIGLVEEPETMLVMEYVDNDSLLKHLQLAKSMKGFLQYSEQFRYALGVAEGMEYLETQRIVHRDLAARNILIGSKHKIKISDFGLAQVIKDHYYKMKTDRNLPVRWYALEAIVERKFSHKSDVWSYGIVLWEIFSLGDNPQIPNVPDIQLHEALQRGQRLRVPDECPYTVYELMRNCWDQDSHKRPSFSELIASLRKIKLEHCSE